MPKGVRKEKMLNPKIEIRGRPEKKIDWDEVGNFFEAGCSGLEVACFLGINEKTLYKRCLDDLNISLSDLISQKRSKGDLHLRFAQHKKALGTADNTMLVWLGKQRLAQKENPTELTISPESAKQFSSLMDQVKALQDKEKG